VRSKGKEELEDGGWQSVVRSRGSEVISVYNVEAGFVY
jgi:hypothetical protein